MAMSDETTTFGAIIERRAPPPPPKANTTLPKEAFPPATNPLILVTSKSSELTSSRPGTATGIRPHYLHLSSSHGAIDQPLPSPFSIPGEDDEASHRLTHHSRASSNGTGTTAAEPHHANADAHHFRQYNSHSLVGDSDSEVSAFDAAEELESQRGGHLESIRGPHTSNTTIGRPIVLTRPPSRSSTPQTHGQTLRPEPLSEKPAAQVIEHAVSAPAIPTVASSQAPSSLPSLTRAATATGITSGTSMWPSVQEIRNKEKAAKRERSNCMWFARLSKKTRVILSIVVGLVVVGTAVGVGVGVSRANHGEVWAGNGRNRPIDSK
jgi:hypothetical protein